MENQQTPPPFPPTPHTPPSYEYDIPKRAKSWLVESILITIFCCLPFGIVGIVYAVKVNSLHDQTRYEESRRASKNAKRWVLIGLMIGLVYLAFIIIMVFLGSLSEFSMPTGPDSLHF